MSAKILVVDNSGTDRRMIERMLVQYSVLVACTGLEALRIIEDNPDIALMILDLDMPNMDGLQVLDVLNANERYRGLRTILLSNHDEWEDEINGLQLGAVDYIRKPIHTDTLKVRIDIHIELFRMQQVFENGLYDKSITFDAIFQQAPIGIAILHSSRPYSAGGHNFISINPVFEQIIGRTKAELQKLGWERITHPDDLNEEMKRFKKLQSGEIKSYSMEKRYIRPEGSAVWVDAVVASLAVSNEDKDHYICLIQDITNRKSLEKNLLESERIKSVLLSNLPGMAYRCKYDRDWTMQFVSDGCLGLTGYLPDSLVCSKDLSFSDLITPEYREQVWIEWGRVLAEKLPFQYEYEITTATGCRKWVLELGQGAYDGEGDVEALEGIILDISDRKDMENNLRYINEHDGWTGLYNRDSLERFLAADAKERYTRKRALVSINLSTVQLLTANYGFHYTQDLIKKAAETLSQYCTKTRLLFKTYENRFAFYLREYKDKNELAEFGEAIAKALEVLFVTERVGGGIGILEIDQDNDLEVDRLLRNLLIASERSINLFDKEFRACFYDEDLEALVYRLGEIREGLARIAVDNTGGELFLQYQPIWDLNANAICGFEALARLRTERLGLVSPAEFIPIAEKTKLIIPIGETIIRSAFRFLNRLKEYGYEAINVSINVSIIQLLRPDFTDRLFALMGEMQVIPENICIEITESTFVSDHETINGIINELRAAGLHVAIDDFGIGYSSLAREKELNVTCLKIDKYFIDKLLEVGPDKAITGDIISIAHRLGHCAIAEGVEQEAQKQYLMDKGCDKIQGYLISRPLDEEAAIALLGKQVGFDHRCHLQDGQG